jgi:hypothetical protein
VAFYLGVSLLMTVFVGPVIGRAVPHFHTYLAAAVCIEIAGLVVSPRRRLRSFALAAGVLIGVVGTVAEWGWSHVWMPIPWPADFVPSAVAISVPAAVCGALVGVFVAGSLSPRRVPRPGRRPWVPAALGVALFGILLAVLVPTHVPDGAKAKLTLTRVDAGPGAHVQATVRVHPASLADGADVVQELAWQGGAPVVQDQMRRVAPGVFRTVKPLPVDGSWKALIRIQNGGAMADAPVYLPADPAIPAAGVAAESGVTRALVTDSKLMQRERKRDVPGWLWGGAVAAVMAAIVALLAIIGAGLNRIATRLPGQGSTSIDDGLGSGRLRPAHVTARRGRAGALR